MEKLLSNPDLSLIISRCLDLKSLAQCRLVCRTWKESIDNDRPWWNHQLEFIHTTKKTFVKPTNTKSRLMTIKEKFPEWLALIEQASIQQRAPVPWLREFVRQMWTYFREDTRFGLNPLQEAVAKSKVEFVQLLIDGEIDLTKLSLKWKLLQFALCFGNFDIVRLLLQHIPAIDATSNISNGATIFQMATTNPDSQVLKLVLNKFKLSDVGTNARGIWKIIQKAVTDLSKDTIQVLLESREIRLKKEAWSNNGCTILHLACQKRQIDIIDLVFNALKDIKSDIDFDTQDRTESTPIHYACENKNSDVAIQLLQRYPEKVNDLGYNNWHLLHYACRYGHLKVVKYLFENPNFNIDFNAVSVNGWTPLHHACYHGRSGVVKYFLKNAEAKEIDITRKIFYHQQTAADLARLKEHDKIFKMFNYCLWDDCSQILNSREALVEHLDARHLKIENFNECCGPLICQWNDCKLGKQQPFESSRIFLAHVRGHLH